MKTDTNPRRSLLAPFLCRPERTAGEAVAELGSLTLADMMMPGVLGARDDVAQALHNCLRQLLPGFFRLQVHQGQEMGGAVFMGSEGGTVNQDQGRRRQGGVWNSGELPAAPAPLGTDIQIRTNPGSETS